MAPEAFCQILSFGWRKKCSAPGPLRAVHVSISRKSTEEVTGPVFGLLGDNSKNCRSPIRKALLCFYEQFVPKWKVAADASLPQKNDRIVVNRSFRTAEMQFLKQLQASSFLRPSSGSTHLFYASLPFFKRAEKKRL